MSDNKKRILIIDDDVRANIEMDKLFERTDVEIEMVIVRSLSRGIDQLQAWAKEGHAADLVDCDFMYVQPGDVPDYRLVSHQGVSEGIGLTKYLVEWADREMPEALRPRKYFMHSNISDEIGKRMPHSLRERVDIHPTAEFSDMASHGDEWPCLNCHYTPLRDFLNKEWGTAYPVTETQIKMQKAELFGEEMTPLDLHDACYEVEEHGLSPQTAFERLDISKLADHFRSQIDREAIEASGQDISHVLYEGNPRFNHGVGNAMVGSLAFNIEKARELRVQGKKAILVLKEFTPADTALLGEADGLVLLGAGSEHLAVVVANHGITAVMECDSDRAPLAFEETSGMQHLVSTEPDIFGKLYRFEEGDEVTLAEDGTLYRDDEVGVVTGKMIKGALPLTQHDPFARSEWEDESYVSSHLIVTGWAEQACAEHGGMIVKANADTPEQVKEAIRIGAAGIGLLRTEHMFFAEERRAALRTALLSDNRSAAYAALKVFQKQDFTEIFAAASQAEREFPITIRLLDAPPEEFLEAEQIAALEARVDTGNMRAVQLAAHTPGLYAMQTEAIFEAAKESGYSGALDLMIPLVRDPDELRAVKEEIATVAERCGMTGKYKFRAMIETPEAVRHAAAIASMVDGISFGTNDLTAEIMGHVKRNDIVATREWMVEHGHAGKSPFLTLAEPVIAAMKEAVEAANLANPSIDMSICGNQVAGDEASILACQEMGLESVSVPARVEYVLPAKIMAGKAALRYPVIRETEKSQGFAAKHPKRDRLTPDESARNL